eukprot:5089122-Prorocentrum_lima.AAC.1
MAHMLQCLVPKPAEDPAGARPERRIAALDRTDPERTSGRQLFLGACVEAAKERDLGRSLGTW